MNEEISQVVDNVRRAFRRSRGVGASLLFVTALVRVTLAAQTRPFSSGAEYQSMLSELRQQTIRPSRMSAGTLIQTPSLPNTVEINETAAVLQFETPGWRIEIAKDRWQMRLTN